MVYGEGTVDALRLSTLRNKSKVVCRVDKRSASTKGELITEIDPYSALHLPD
jgi:hypothetical protein